MTETTNAATWVDRLEELNACSEAVAWARRHSSLADAWAACERGDWMLWLAGKVSGKPESEDRKRLVLCACACARTALRFVPTGEERPRIAIETAERWARGEATRAEVRAARRNAYAAYAAYDAAYAASAAAAAAAYDAAYAASAADAAAYAAAAAAAARVKALKECANIVRQHYPAPPQI